MAQTYESGKRGYCCLKVTEHLKNKEIMGLFIQCTFIVLIHIFAIWSERTLSMGVYADLWENFVYPKVIIIVIKFIHPCNYFSIKPKRIAYHNRFLYSVIKLIKSVIYDLGLFRFLWMNKLFAFFSLLSSV